MIENSKLEKIFDELLRMEKKENNKVKLSRIKFCQEFIERTIMNNISLEETCPFNYFYIGKSFKDYLDGNYKEDFNTFYLFCARFLKEYILYLERLKTYPINPFIKSLWDDFEYDDLSSLDNRSIQKIEYIKNNLSVDILNFYLGEDGFSAFKEYEKSKIHIDETNKKILENRERIETFISEKEESVKRLEKALNKQKTAFNFVGLSKGFEDLLEKKDCSKCWTFIFLILTGTASLVTPLGYVYSLFHLPDLVQNTELWKQVIPFIGLEIIFLYFFRVILNHYNSIQTQIMQLELRQSLCRFIQNYTDYAKEIKEKDGASLEKFENLIFSSILSTPDKVPSTFDGLDQLANIVKEMRKS